ncbi:MAG: hypothetical protein ACRDE8_16900 [Ginsengibacter sp.]
MKKIITLLFSLGLFATSFAQYNHQQNNEWNKRNDQYATSNGKYNNRWDDHNFSAGDRDFQVEKINRDFAYKIRMIQNDRYMRHREKRAAIREAKNERSRQIQWVNERFSRRFHRGYR